MKKYICLFAVAALTLVATTACTESKLQQKVDEANRECPKEMGLFGEITSVELVDSNVVFTYTVDESFINIGALNDAPPELIKKNALLIFRHPTKDFHDLLATLVEERAGLVISFTGSESGKVFSIAFSADDLLATAHSEETQDHETALLGHAEFVNAQCPMEVEKGVTLVNVSVDDSFLVYNCRIDSVYTIAELNATNDLARPEVIRSLNGDDPVKDIVLTLCERAGKGIAIRYTAEDTEEECVIAIPVFELRETPEEWTEDEVADEEEEEEAEDEE